MSKGPFRPVYRSLLYNSRFQALTSDGKSLWLALKLRLGPAGIDRIYREELAEVTGLDDAALTAAVEELTRHRWIETEGSLYWLVEGFACEPLMQAPNAIGSIKTHIDGLRGAIVDRYRERYDFKGTPMGSGKGSGMGSPMGKAKGPQEPTHGATLAPTHGPRDVSSSSLSSSSSGTGSSKDKQHTHTPPSSDSPGRCGLQPCVCGRCGKPKTARMKPIAVMAAWEAARGAPLTDAERKGQRSWANKLSCDGVSDEEMAEALAGMDDVMRGAPWDLRDLRFQLAKAKTFGRGRRHEKKRRVEALKIRAREERRANKPMTNEAMRKTLREHAPDVADKLEGNA